MKNRTITLLSQEIGDLLVSQISHELNNHALYMSFAAYFSRNGLKQLEDYYRHRAHEEFNHHQWIVDYLIEGDFDFNYPEVKAITKKINEHSEPFGLTTTREIETTQLLFAIYEQALLEKDYMTASWLYEKLIKEQIEEENLTRMVESISELDCDWLIKSEKIYDLVNN